MENPQVPLNDEVVATLFATGFPIEVKAHYNDGHFVLTTHMRGGDPMRPVAVVEVLPDGRVSIRSDDVD